LNASHVVLYRYTIPFTEPVTVKRQRLVQREGIIIALRSTDGEHIAYGEIAPLPGLHNETLELAEAQLVDLLSKRGMTTPDSLPEELYPSVRTGVEMAMINLDTAISGALPSFSETGEAVQQVPVLRG
jgi:O-succinylbenzoate synthase